MDVDAELGELDELSRQLLAGKETEYERQLDRVMPPYAPDKIELRSPLEKHREIVDEAIDLVAGSQLMKDSVYYLPPYFEEKFCNLMTLLDPKAISHLTQLVDEKLVKFGFAMKAYRTKGLYGIHRPAWAGSKWEDRNVDLNINHRKMGVVEGQVPPLAPHSPLTVRDKTLLHNIWQEMKESGDHDTTDFET